MSAPEDTVGTPVPEQPSGVLPAGRPLRNPRTVESFQPVVGDEIPHVPARPLRRPSTEATIGSGSGIEKGVSEMEPVAAEPVVPRRPVIARAYSSTSSLGEVAPPAQVASASGETSKESQPFVPPRPTRVPASHEQQTPVSAEEEPRIPTRPARNVERNMEKQQPAVVQTGAVAEPKVPSRPLRRPATGEHLAVGHPTSTEDATAEKEIPVPPRPHRDANHAEEEKNENIEDTSADANIEDESAVASESTTPFSKDEDESEMVEPLMPKRPVRRTTEDIQTPSVPLRPRKAATSGDLLAAKHPSLEAVESVEVKEDEPREDTMEEDEVSEEKPVEALDVISATSGTPEAAVLEVQEETKDSSNVPDATEASTSNEAVTTAEPTLKESELPENEPKVAEEQIPEPQSKTETQVEQTPTATEPIVSTTTEAAPKTEVDASKEPSTGNEPTPAQSKERLPSVPARPARKGPPPVPKKPSSKIAAFHQMLQRQQMKNLGMEEPEEAASPAPTQEEQPTTSASPDQDSTQAPERPPVAPSKRPTPAATRNMNGMFALPGMIPGMLPGMVPGGVLPPSLSKKLGISTPDEDAGNDSKPQGALSDVRQRRARGPRGRKLPTKISKIEKVVDTTGSNEIEMFSTWSVTVTPKPVASEATAAPASQPDIETDTETEVQPVHEEVSLEQPVPVQASEPTVSVADISVSETPISVGEAIETMDGDEKPVCLEQELEEMAESLMQKEMLKGDIDEMEVNEEMETVEPRPEQEEDGFGEPVPEEDIPK